MKSPHLIKPLTLGIAVLVSLTSCSKTEDRHTKPNVKTADQAASDAAGDSTRAQSGDSTRAQSGDSTRAQSGDSTRAQSGDSTRAQSGDSTRAQSGDSTRAQSRDSTRAQSGDSTRAQSGDSTRAQSGDSTRAQMPVIKKLDVTKNEKALASDSEQIKKEGTIRIQFKDLSGLIGFSLQSKVMFQQKLVEESAAKVQILNSNEESYCKLQTSETFNKADFLKLENIVMKEVNKEFDIYESTLTFKNANGALNFICTHATSNYYIEDFYKNLNAYIDVSGVEGKLFDIKSYKNPRTENRILNAIKLIDTKSLEQIVIDESQKEGLGLANGKVDSIDKLTNLIAGGKEKIACMIAEKAGDFDSSKIYIRVGKGIAVDTPKDIPTATMYTIYRADEKNYFVITCLMQKDAPWSQLMEAAGGPIQFGVLNRIDYNKKYDEVMEIHKRLEGKK